MKNLTSYEGELYPETPTNRRDHCDGTNGNEGNVMQKQLFTFYKLMVVKWEFFYWFLKSGKKPFVNDLSLFIICDNLMSFSTQFCFQTDLSPTRIILYN